MTKAVGEKRAMSGPEAMAFSTRLYKSGHKPEDFHGNLAPHLVAVLPVLPPEQMGGLHLPGAATEKVGTQFALAHIVAALPYTPFLLWEGTPSERELCVGDVVKLYEAHIDPMEPARVNIASVPAEHVKAVLFAACAVDTLQAAPAEGDDAELEASDADE